MVLGGLPTARSRSEPRVARGSRQGGVPPRSARGRPRAAPCRRRPRRSRARVVVTREIRRVQRDACHVRRPSGQRDPLVQLDELRERRDRVPGQPSISVAPARWQRTNACGADPCIRPSVTPEYMGGTIEPCPSTSKSFPPRRAPSTTSCSAAPARKSETTASTAIPHPAIAIPVCPVGTNTDSRPRRRASRSSSTATVFFPIAQSDPTVSTIFASTSRFAPVGTFRPGGRLAEIAQLDPVPASELAQLWILGDELVQAALDVETAGDTALQELAPRGREPASLGRDAHDRHRGLERNGVGDGPDDGNAVMRLSRSGGVEDRDDRVRAVANDPAHGLPVVRIVREPLAENEDAPLVAHVAATPRPGASEGTCTPSTSSTPG